MRNAPPRARSVFAAAAFAVCVASCHTRPATTFTPVVTYTQAPAWRPSATESARYEPVLQVATGAGSALTPDPALANVASELARRVARDPQGRPPSARVVQAVAWLAGVTDPIPTVLAVRGSPGTTERAIETSLQDVVRTDHPTHVGVAKLTVDNLEVLVVALTERRVRLEPIARSVSVGARVAVRGALAPGLRTPGLVITRPDGHTEETQLGEGPDFFGQFPAAARGVYQVEITADSDVGSTVVANFPVYVDSEPPATPEETSANAVEEPAAVEATLLQAINEARSRAHLRPLETLALLAEVARSHSRDMAEHRFVAHNSPTQGTPGQRLRAAGLQSGLSLENVGRGYGAREIHDGLMASPGHRANILNDRVTHVGIGVVREPGPTGGLLVTQDFIEVARPIDTAAAARELVASINRTRQSRGLAPFEERPQLQQAADTAARSFFANPTRTQQEVFNEATQTLQREALLFRRISIAGAFGPRLEGADRLEPLFDRDMRTIGVGVAQGDRPDAPPQSVFVVYVMAVPR